uniref:Uncharacterized protein n=1 Tax=Oryza nivara TaxID=4536 RepID=A0A0E0G3K6_ORYNI
MATKLTEAKTAPVALFLAAAGASANAGVSSLLDGAIPAPAWVGLNAAADESAFVDLLVALAAASSSDTDTTTTIAACSNHHHHHK